MRGIAHITPQQQIGVIFNDDEVTGDTVGFVYYPLGVPVFLVQIDIHEKLVRA